MRFTTSGLLCLALLIFGSRSWAQNPAQTKEQTLTPEQKAWQSFFFEEVLQRSCDDPTLKSAIALPQPKLTLETSADGTTTANLRVGVEVKNKFVLDLVVTSPKDSSGKPAVNGLSDGSTADLSFSWFAPSWLMPKSSVGYETKMLEDVYRIPNVQRLSNIGILKEREALEDKVKGGATLSMDEATRLEMLKLRAQQIKIDPTSVDNEWTVEDYLNPVTSRPSAIALLGPKAYDEVMAAYRTNMPSSVPVLTLKAHAEQKDFQPMDASKESQPALVTKSHTNFQITASAGSYLWRTVYASLNYRRGTEFKVDTTAGPLPKSQKAEALEFEIRSLFKSFGVGAHVTRDIHANLTTVEIPLYFLPKIGATDIELNGGVKLKCQSDTRKCSISAFVGPALSTVLRMFGNKNTN